MFKLGKLPARPGAVSFRFPNYFDLEKLPTPPTVFGHSLGLHFGMLGNDSVGNCVWAGADHEHMIWSREGVAPDAYFTAANALADYADATGYNPSDPNSDQGTDMQMAASYRRKTGIVDAKGVRHKVTAYVALDHHDLDELATAAYLFGAIGLGFMFPMSADEQFKHGTPWEVVHGARIAGGHYVPVVGRNSHGHFLVVTWGRIHAATPEFITTYADEALCYLTTELLDAAGLSPEGFDQAQLQRDLQRLGA